MPAPKQTGIGKYLGFIIIFIFIAVIILLATSGHPKSSPKTINGTTSIAQVHNVTLLAANQSILLTSSSSSSFPRRASYNVTNFTVPKNSSSAGIIGSFNSSNGKVEAYILTFYEYSNFLSNQYSLQNPSNSMWSSGYSFFPAYINYNYLDKTKYYLVFFNPAYSSANVRIRSPVVLQYST